MEVDDSNIIPTHHSPVRSMTDKAHGTQYIAFKNLDEARAHDHASVVMEGDSGGQIYLTCSVKHVKCSEAVLRQLLKEIDRFAWGDGEIFYEVLPVGSGVDGGMGGGKVVDGVWVHETFKALGLEPSICAVIAGGVMSIFDGPFEVGAIGKHGESPLHYAVKENHRAFFEALVRARTDANARDERGMTPLHYAAWKGNEAFIQALIDSGANVNAEDDRNWTPLFYARKYLEKPKAVVELLKSRGGIAKPDLFKNNA